MNWYGSGFIPIINYSAFAESLNDSFDILTEDNNALLTETAIELLTEDAP